MIQSLLFVLVIGIGLFYAFKYGNNAKKNSIEYLNKTTGTKTTQDLVELKYFGKIDLNKTEEHIDIHTSINGNKVAIDLNIMEDQISRPTIEPTRVFLENLNDIEKVARKKVVSDFQNGTVVKGYINHHLRAFNANELKSLGIESTDTSENNEQKFLDKIHLKRIGIYPEEWDSLAIFDFTINADFTQYLIVLKFNSNGEFVDIYTES